MRAYWKAFKVAAQSGLQHKANTLFYLSYVLVPSLAVFFLWHTVLGENMTLGAYDLRAIVTYYLVTQFCVTNTPGIWTRIGEDIRSGRLALYLVRPASYYGLYLAEVSGSMTLLWLTSLVGLGATAVFLRSYFQFQTDPVLVFASLLLWLGGVVLALTWGYLLNLIAFWTERSTGITSLVSETLMFLAGGVVPLDLLPLQRLWLALPFRFVGWLPAQVYLGRVPREALPFEFLKLLGWFAAFFALSQWMWLRGLRRFQGAEG